MSTQTYSLTLFNTAEGKTMIAVIFDGVNMGTCTNYSSAESIALEIVARRETAIQTEHAATFNGTPAESYDALRAREWPRQDLLDAAGLRSLAEIEASTAAALARVEAAAEAERARAAVADYQERLEEVAQQERDAERQGEENEALYALEAGIVAQDDGSCNSYSNCAAPAPALLQLPRRRRKPATTKRPCCMFCAQEQVTGVFFCKTGQEFIALSNGKHIAAGPKYLPVDEALKDYHYSLLTHGSDADGEQAADMVAARAA